LKGFKRYYDTCSQTPFLFNPKRKYFLSYDDTTSITAKAAFAKSKGMAGLSVFHASGLPSSVYKAMKKNL
jgi:chitinase